jgi:leucyl aminopeptidase (aminopeptidase T)
MIDYDVILIATTKSLSHTNARKNATNAGARIASMPGITKEILQRAIDVDYEKMKLLGTKLKEAIAGKTNVTLVTQKGTMLTFSIKGRNAEGGQAGLCVNAGDWDNLPAGEAYVAPLEGTANGVVIIDASIAGIGKLDKSVRVVVENGFAVKIEGAEEAEILRKLLYKCGSLAFNIAEFGIGTNSRAKVTGAILEDEKAIGTCHIAFGSNFSFGGTVNAGLHLDGVIMKPTVFVDNKKIMENGKFLI